MTKSKIHEFIIKVKFDKPCNKSLALFHIKDQLQGHLKSLDALGSYFTDDTLPSIMNVTKISKIKDK